MITDSRYNDNFLYFKEDGHKYTDTSGSEYLSVTTLIGNYVESFNENIGHIVRLKNKVEVRSLLKLNGIE